MQVPPRHAVNVQHFVAPPAREPVFIGESFLLSFGGREGWGVTRTQQHRLCGPSKGPRPEFGRKCRANSESKLRVRNAKFHICYSPLPPVGYTVGCCRLQCSTALVNKFAGRSGTSSPGERQRDIITTPRCSRVLPQEPEARRRARSGGALEALFHTSSLPEGPQSSRSAHFDVSGCVPGAPYMLTTFSLEAAVKKLEKIVLKKYAKNVSLYFSEFC
jgi:hypothetical protein